MKLTDIITYTHPKIFCEKFSKEINGKFEIKRLTITGGDGFDHYTISIKTKYQDIDLELKSAFRQSPGKFEEYLIWNVGIYSEIENQSEFYLYLWRKDFFDKILGFNKSIIGYENFDSVIGFKSNNKEDVMKFFANKEIRDLIINDKNSVFNIRFEKEILKIKLQMNQYITRIEVFKELYFKYLYYLDRLIKVGIIRTPTYNTR
jgi:hypothetical protein